MTPINLPSLTPLRVIDSPGGVVMHGMKAGDPGFAGFGEAYFSVVDYEVVKGWKRHREMTLNLIVVRGEIRFVLHKEGQSTLDFQLTPDMHGCYARLTVPPGWWMAFGGIGRNQNMLLNVASIPHDPAEADRVSLEAMAWSWH